MITLPPPYNLIESTLGMNTRIKQAKRRNTNRLTRRRERVEEIDEQAMNAERIEADPDLGSGLSANKTAWLIAACLLISIIGGIVAAWS